MSAVLDSVLFLSLTVHIAFVIAYLASDSLATEVTGGNSPGGEIYNEILLLFTTHITLCPCLAIMNTPHQWKEISRRGFRLLTITAIVIMNGIPIIRMFNIYVRDLQVKLDSKITPIESGCVTVFLWKINSWSTEVLIAIASWIICVVSLLISIIRQLRYELRKPESRCSTLLQLLRIPNPVKDRTTTTPPEVDTEAQSSTQPPTLPTKILKILSLTVYTIIYIYLQALPLYYLWRIRWMRRHVRSIIQPPSPSNILYPPFADLQSSLAEELNNWDNDDWSFGQILTLSLWSPALLEFFYILIGKSRTLAHYEYHANKLAAGEDCVLTGRLPENWKAVEDLNSKAKHDIENDDEREEVASQATPKTTPEKTPGQTTAET